MYEEIRVKNILDEVYREHGRTEASKGSHDDPDSKSSLELSARRRAFTDLTVADRRVISRAAKDIIEQTGLKRDAGLSVLMHLGIFLIACERRRR